MKGLKVENWQQWEELTCYLLQHFIRQQTNNVIEFQTYGTRGQSQYGIDLVPRYPQVGNLAGIVGQSKLKETNLSWNDVYAELKKTDNYPNIIRCYILFTTANYHTTIQDKLNHEPYYYTRPNGEKFRVLVKYFSDYEDLSFVPQNVLSRLFPAAFSLFKAGQDSREAYLESIRAMKEFIPRWLNTSSITWLDTWDFSCGYVKESDFRCFYDLWLEYDRTVTALRHEGLTSWVTEGERIYISKCLPAANEFFEALTNFQMSVSESIIGRDDILTLEGIPKNQWPRITNNWSSNAAQLSYLYKKDILGQYQY
ncbi:hypothetical protein [Photobacterium leiognathi]|uniref:hypothetical protein n=1 Tax=Photobacterium leiognathi TaxID=553611 RepID=UPI002982993A|nr:hypothetical protein [Photobacterium leiognathi]